MNYVFIKSIVNKLLSKAKIKHLFIIATNATEGLTKVFNRSVSNELTIVKDTSNSSYFLSLTIDNTTKKINGTAYIGDELEYLYQLTDVYINPDDGAPLYYANYFLKLYNNQWITSPPVSLSLNTSFNSNVNVTNLQNNQYLIYNDYMWKNTTYNVPSNIQLQLESSFEDVQITDKQDGQILQVSTVSSIKKYINKALSVSGSDAVFNKVSLIYRPFSISTALYSVPNILFPTSNVWVQSGTTNINTYAFYFASQYTGQLTTISFIVANGKSTFTERAYFKIGVKIVSSNPNGSSLTDQNISGLPGEKITINLPLPYNAVKNETFWVIIRFTQPNAPIGIGAADSGCLMGSKVYQDSAQPNFSSIYVNSGGGTALSSYPANGSYIPYFELY